MSKHADELLREWFRKASVLEAAHTNASSFYQKKDAYIAIPSIIISALSGSISFTTTGLPDNVKNKFLYLAGALNVINTIIASIKEYFSWGKKQYDHGTAAVAYQKLKNHIEIQLALHKMGLDIPYDTIISETGSLITKIDNDSPQLPKHIRDKVEFGERIIDIMVETNTDVDKDSINDIIDGLD
jgi:hypothetical protein